VHAAWLGLIVFAGVVFLLPLWVGWQVFAAVVLLGVAAVVRPRLGRLDDLHGEYAVRVRPDDAPELFAVIDAVTDALGARPPQHVLLDSQYNAACAVLGWRRQRVLVLGMPLVSVLSGQELVALLAHEIAHESQR
jgi:heat shock protein HtpX